MHSARVQLIDMRIPLETLYAGGGQHEADWCSVEIQVSNQTCIVTEKLWFNFLPDRVHWASLGGRDRGMDGQAQADGLVV